MGPFGRRRHGDLSQCCSYECSFGFRGIAIDARASIPDQMNLAVSAVSLIRSRGHYLGIIDAPDVKAAEAAAVRECARRGATATCCPECRMNPRNGLIRRSGLR
jgi:hypothetical protein